MTQFTSFGPLVRLLSFFSCFYIYANHLIGSNGIIKLRKYLREVTTKRTGPNDANRIVWAISKCFYFYFSCFLIILNHFIRFYCYCGGTDGYTGGYDEENEPKRRESRRLGRGCVFFLLFVFLLY